jgi:hypothetical protein
LASAQGCLFVLLSLNEPNQDQGAATCWFTLEEAVSFSMLLRNPLSGGYAGHIYSTNIGTEYFKYGIYTPFFFFLMQFVS